ERLAHPPGRATRAPVGWSVELGIRGYDVNTCWYCNVITVDIPAQCSRHVIHKRSAPVGSQPRDFLRDRKRCEMTRDKLRRQWELSHLGGRMDANILKASRGDEPVQLHGVIERIGRSHHGAGALAHMSFERIGEGRAVRAIRDGAPDRERQTAAVMENSSHLTQALKTLGEVLDALLTEHH